MGRENSGRGPSARLRGRSSLASFCEYLFGNVKGGICRWNATIDRGMQKDFLNFFAGDSTIGRGPQVKAEFIGAIQRHHHSNGDQAAGLARQARAGPYFSQAQRVMKSWNGALNSLSSAFARSTWASPSTSRRTFIPALCRFRSSIDTLP